MARSDRPFARPAARFKPQPKVLVLCEDAKSARDYLDDAARDFRAFASVEHCGRTDPPGIVAEALSRQHGYEEIHCVFDRDDHPGFDQARSDAKQSEKICVVTSYPCFEFWLLMHFGYRRTPFRSAGTRSAGDQLLRELRNQAEMSDYAKGNAKGLYASLTSRLPEARKHAARALVDAIDTREPNPSTQIHLLIARFEPLSEPRP
jgi:hypothetical protein